MAKYKVSWTEHHEATLDAEDEDDALEVASLDSDWWQETWVKGKKKDMKAELIKEEDESKRD